MDTNTRIKLFNLITEQCLPLAFSIGELQLVAVKTTVGASADIQGEAAGFWLSTGFQVKGLETLRSFFQVTKKSQAVGGLRQKISTTGAA